MSRRPFCPTAGIPVPHLETTDSAIYLGALDGDAPTRLTSAGSKAVYLPPGWLLWVRAGTQTLVAQRLDSAKASLTGELVTVADGVGGFSAAATGRWPTGRERPAATDLGRSLRHGARHGGDDSRALACGFSEPRVSPDGLRVAVYRTVEGNTDVWLLDGLRMSRFTFDAAARPASHLVT